MKALEAASYLDSIALTTITNGFDGFCLFPVKFYSWHVFVHVGLYVYLIAYYLYFSLATSWVGMKRCHDPN